jgi:taurine dioxygenase
VTLGITPLDAPLGARVVGVDLCNRLSDEVFQTIRDAWLKHVVLVFPEQEIDGPAQLSFAERFGPLKKRGRPEDRRPEAEGRDYDAQVMFVSNIIEDGAPIGSLPDGEMWFHHDGCYKEHPQRASFLHALEIPHTGGNTLFGNMYLAYEKMPAELKNMLADKTALHVYDYEMRKRYDTESGLDGIAHFTHPVFIRHPDTGRTALYVNRLMTARINELPLDESDAALAELFKISEGSSVVYEHEWTVGDFVMWDNLCSIHARTDFPPTDRRLMRRCVIEGVRPGPA